METRKVFYKRYKRRNHFVPAPGYNCPKIPLGGINAKGPDYEVVRVLKAEGCSLRNRKVLISWGLNIPANKWPKIKQVIAIPNLFPDQKFGEIVLGVD